MQRLYTNMSCLACDKIKHGMLMLGCGHSICNECMVTHSTTSHERSSVKCETCTDETLVIKLRVSYPIRQVADSFNKIEVTCKKAIQMMQNSDLVDLVVEKFL